MQVNDTLHFCGIFPKSTSRHASKGQIRVDSLMLGLVTGMKSNLDIRLQFR